MHDQLAGAARVTARQRLGLALKGFAESILESTSKPRADRASATHQIRMAVRQARAGWRNQT
jgi:hypothetical protein